MNKKITIAFDVSVLGSVGISNVGRSGIVLTTLEILKRLIQNEKLIIFAYCSKNDLEGFHLLQKREPLLSSLQIINNQKFFWDKKFYLAKKIKSIKNKYPQYFNFVLLKYFHSFYLKFVNIIRVLYLKKTKREYSDIDVFFSPVFSIPEEIKGISHIKKYVFIYDMIPWICKDIYPFINYWFEDLMSKINKKDGYFTDSQSAKEDLIKYSNKKVTSRQITVALLAASERFYHCHDIEKNNILKKKYNIPLDKKYIFSLCVLDPRKNLITAIRCFITFIRKNNIQDMYFALGGGHYNDYVKTFEKEFESFGEYKKYIIRTGYIEDNDLASIYSWAEFFVYPSLYEGFGLPVLEAMQCGCPVITSNNSSLPEVIGDAGILIEPQNEEMIVSAMEKIYYNYDFKKMCIQKGLERARLFNWDKTVNIIINRMASDLNIL